MKLVGYLDQGCKNTIYYSLREKTENRIIDAYLCVMIF